MEKDGFSLKAFYFTDLRIHMLKKQLKGHTYAYIYPCGKVYSKTIF